MVFQITQLHIVLRIHALLPGHSVGIGTQGKLALQVAPEDAEDIVIISRIKGLENLRIGMGHQALSTQIPDELRLNGFAEPEAAGMNLFHLRPGFQPEGQRHHGSHVAAEAIHNSCPHFQRFNLVIPQVGPVVIQIHNIRPVAHMVSEAAIGLVIEPFGMILHQPGIGRSVIVHHIDDALHAQAVDILHQRPEVLHGAVLRIHRPVI